MDRFTQDTAEKTVCAVVEDVIQQLPKEAP